MSVTVRDIKTLKAGDYIEASGLYFKVLENNVKAETFTMSNAFERGSVAPERTWGGNYNGEVEKIDYQYWTIIKAKSKAAKGIEKKVA